MKTYGIQVQFTVETASSEDEFKYMYSKIYMQI